jgi:ABC-2 type transport system permease protein
MAGPLRHDFARTMKSKSVLLSMAVIIALSFALVPLIGLATGPSVSSSGDTAVVGFYSGGTYHFLAYSYNTYGQPVIGTSVNVTLTDSTGAHSSEATTNSSGFASWTLQAVPQGSQVVYSVSVDGSIRGEGSFFSGAVPGEVFSLSGSPISVVVDPANSSHRKVLFFFEGPNGTLPDIYRVYYSYGNPQGPVGGSLNASQMTLLGTPASYLSSFNLPQAPQNATLMSLAVFEAAPPNNLIAGYSEQTVGGTLTPPSPGNVFTSFTGTILAIVVPLMSILIAYNSYGKDRATGVLESVLARPVTRRSLGFSRYLSFVIAVSVALMITIGIAGVISQSLLGEGLPVTFAAYTAGSLIVEAAAFIGIVMLLSQVVRSQGNMILVSVGLWVMLDFFWTVLVFVASAVLSVQVGSGNYLALTIQSSFFNPAQFYSLVGEYLNGISISTGFGGSTPISPATYGLTPLTLALTGAFWVLAPLFGFLYLVVRRD